MVKVPDECVHSLSLYGRMWRGVWQLLFLLTTFCELLLLNESINQSYIFLATLPSVGAVMLWLS